MLAQNQVDVILPDQRMPDMTGVEFLRAAKKTWDDAQLRRHLEEAFQVKQMANENRRLDPNVRTANHELASNIRQLEAALKQSQDQISHVEADLVVAHEALQIRRCR